MIQIREVVFVLCIFKSGNFFLAHKVHPVHSDVGSFELPHYP